MPSFKQALCQGAWVSLSLREGVCLGGHLLCQPGTPSSGPGRLVDTPRGGPGFRVRKKVWPRAPGVGSSPDAEGTHIRVSCGSRVSVPHRGSLAATPGQPQKRHRAPGPVQGMGGGGRAHVFWAAVCLRGGLFCRRVSPGGDSSLALGGQRILQGGGAGPHSAAGTPGPVPASGSWPLVLSVALGLRSLESDRPEFKS